MKMNLKHNLKFKLNIFNKKNYFIFLVSFSITSLIIGIIFFYYLNSNDQEIVKNNITNYFVLETNYNYLKIFYEAIKNNIISSFIIWVLGISVLGFILVLFLFFNASFSLGFSLASIISTYKFKGVLGIFFYLFPSKLLYLFIIFYLTYFSLKFSYDFIKTIMSKKEVDFSFKLKKYSKIFIISLVFILLCSLFEAFLTPFMIKAFTFLVK